MMTRNNLDLRSIARVDRMAARPIDSRLSCSVLRWGNPLIALLKPLILVVMGRLAGATVAVRPPALFRRVCPVSPPPRSPVTGRDSAPCEPPPCGRSRHLVAGDVWPSATASARAIRSAEPPGSPVPASVDGGSPPFPAPTRTVTSRSRVDIDSATDVRWLASSWARPVGTRRFDLRLTGDGEESVLASDPRLRSGRVRCRLDSGLPAFLGALGYSQPTSPKHPGHRQRRGPAQSTHPGAGGRPLTAIDWHY